MKDRVFPAAGVEAGIDGDGAVLLSHELIILTIDEIAGIKHIRIMKETYHGGEEPCRLESQPLDAAGRPVIISTWQKMKTPSS